jgi:hypothetical protein
LSGTGNLLLDVESEDVIDEPVNAVVREPLRPVEIVKMSRLVRAVTVDAGVNEPPGHVPDGLMLLAGDHADVDVAGRDDFRG